MVFHRQLLSTAIVGIAILAACGGGNSSPTVVPTPTPKPTATPVPLLAGCNLTPMPDLRNQCPELTPRYGGVVDGAIKKVFEDHPELFDFTVAKGGGLFSFKVLDHRKYTGAVVENLRGMGYCAVDQLEEIAVKQTQEFNEQYNIYTSDGFARLPPGAYITTCFPAQF